MHQEKVEENKSSTYLNLGYGDIDQIRPIPIQETNLPIVRNHIDYQSARPNKILKTAGDFNKGPDIKRTLRFADKVEVIPRLNLGEVGYRVQGFNGTYQLYDQSREHVAETEPLQLEKNKKKWSLVYEFEDALYNMKIICLKLFDPNASVNEKLKELSKIQAQYPYFYANKPELFEAYRQYIQKTHRYIRGTIKSQDIVDKLDDLLTKFDIVCMSVQNLNKEEFVPKKILDDVWDTLNGLRDLKRRWGYLDDLNLDDNHKSSLKKIKDIISKNREDIEYCISSLKEYLSSIHEIDKNCYEKLQSEAFKEFDSMNIGHDFTCDDALKAYGIIQNIAGIRKRVAKKYRMCIERNMEFGYLYAHWDKYVNELNSRLKMVQRKTIFNYVGEQGKFGRERGNENLGNNENKTGIELLKSIQYVESRLQKINYIIKRYPMNLEDKNEDAYWKNQVNRYLKIRDNLLELEWEHYKKQKDNYINYERLFNECLGKKIGLMRLGIMRNTIIYSISRIQKLFPNVLSSNNEENEFWKSQEKKYLGK